ncbi:lamin tail domain-containing protein [Flavivirga sp. 57AJ16]|uniref:lamin tail domain-containing protein n=1 Tax=Flavivirga sp. 57AJ16 TaxID=3025307 RepID=UPI002365A7A2|nr:lamin tail domain-containing protein [Flavivirga sp. 57AJ16]MDD7886264.1 lamin tail domain-containing protein [Flavivirga sp. 57AJ16]
MTKITLFILVCLTTFIVNAQTTVFQENFETGNSATQSVENCNDGDSDFFIRTNGSDISSNYEVSDKEGDYFFAAQDLDGDCGNITQTLLFDDINISGYTSLALSLLAAEDQADDGLGDWDPEDMVSIAVDYDNSGTFTKVLQFAADNSASNRTPGLDADFDGTNDGTQNLTSAFAEFTAPLGTGTVMDVLITFTLTSGEEDIAIDDFRIIDGVPPSVGFDTITTNLEETDATQSISIPVTLLGYSGSNVSLSVSVDGSSTADAGDYTLNTSTLTFTGNGTQNILVDIHDDADTGELESLVLVMSETTSTGSTLLKDTHTIFIQDDDFLVINEVLTRPDSDANGDGTSSSSEDEFIEIINNSGSSIDISNYEIHDGAEMRHVFLSTTIPAGGSIVIFGGGTPTGISGLVQTASTGSFALNNGGDTVTLYNGVGDILLQHVFGATPNLSDGSFARNPDISGAFVFHTTIATNPVKYSPGLFNADGTTLSTKENRISQDLLIYQTKYNTLKVKGLEDSNANLKMYSVLGKEIASESLLNNKEIDLTNLSTGIYFVRIQDNNGIYLKKIFLRGK